MQTSRTWLATLLWLAPTGCAEHTAMSTPDAALPASPESDAATDTSAPHASAPRPSASAVIPIETEGFVPDQVEPGSWEPATCGDKAQRVDVRGSSPLGPLHVTSIGVRYWSGFTYGTGLRLEGTLSDQVVVITAENATSPNDEGLSAKLPLGSYRPGDSWDDLYVTLTTSETQVSLHDAELTIEQHASTLPLRRGAPIDLRGKLRIFDSGWSLEVPFAITSVCETSFEGEPP